TTRLESKSPNAVAQTRSAVGHPPTRFGVLAYIQQPPQKCAGGDHDRFCPNLHAQVRGHADDSPIANDNSTRYSLQQSKIRCLIEDSHSPKLIASLSAFNP